MEAFETGLRLVIIGQLSLSTLIIAFRSPLRISIPMGLLFCSVAAYLLKTSPPIMAQLGSFRDLFFLAAMSIPYLVWACAWALFDFERPHVFWMIALPTVTFGLCGTHIVNPSADLFLQMSIHLVALIPLAHALLSVLRGSLDDLLEPRRRFRVGFVVCTASLTTYMLLQEWVFPDFAMPEWMEFCNVILIQLVVLAISVPLLTHDFTEPAPTGPVTLPPEDPDIMDLASQRSHSRLLEAMENRAYARTGLTIRSLAEELGTPEHQLRKLINQSLGYRNFSTFLNGYRIAETCRRLEDPEEARLPILTIALDAGFASLAPFNRAFKAAMGVTPSEYRRANAPAGGTVANLVVQAD